MAENKESNLIGVKRKRDDPTEVCKCNTHFLNQLNSVVASSSFLKKDGGTKNKKKSYPQPRENQTRSFCFYKASAEKTDLKVKKSIKGIQIANMSCVSFHMRILPGAR